MPLIFGQLFDFVLSVDFFVGLCAANQRLEDWGKLLDDVFIATTILDWIASCAMSRSSALPEKATARKIRLAKSK